MALVNTKVNAQLLVQVLCLFEKCCVRTAGADGTHTKVHRVKPSSVILRWTAPRQPVSHQRKVAQVPSRAVDLQTPHSQWAGALRTARRRWPRRTPPTQRRRPSSERRLSSQSSRAATTRRRIWHWRRSCARRTRSTCQKMSSTETSRRPWTP